MNRWLSRFAMTFFIVAALLVWQLYLGVTGRGPNELWRIAAYAVGAGVSGALGVAGIRARHAINKYGAPHDSFKQ